MMKIMQCNTIHINIKCVEWSLIIFFLWWCNIWLLFQNIFIERLTFMFSFNFLWSRYFLDVTILFLQTSPNNTLSFCPLTQTQHHFNQVHYIQNSKLVQIGCFLGLFLHSSAEARFCPKYSGLIYSTNILDLIKLPLLGWAKNGLLSMLLSSFDYPSI